MEKWQTVIHKSGDKGYIVEIEKVSGGRDTIIEIEKADGSKRRDYIDYFRPLFKGEVVRWQNVSSFFPYQSSPCPKERRNMREIKFRAWDKELRVMVDWRGMNKFNDLYDALDCNHYDVATATYALMQYTGLKDKNGKEIYEGDIVKDYNGNILQVSWADCWARYMMSLDGRNCMYYLEDYNHNKPDCLARNMRIIGNIYENPELKEDK